MFSGTTKTWTENRLVVQEKEFQKKLTFHVTKGPETENPVQRNQKIPLEDNDTDNKCGNNNNPKSGVTGGNKKTKIKRDPRR